MASIPMMNECTGFIPTSGELSQGDGYAQSHRRETPNCTECVYFSRRNCGRDTGHDDFLFEQQIL